LLNMQSVRVGAGAAGDGTWHGARGGLPWRGGSPAGQAPTGTGCTLQGNPVLKPPAAVRIKGVPAGKNAFSLRFALVYCPYLVLWRVDSLSSWLSRNNPTGSSSSLKTPSAWPIFVACSTSTSARSSSG